VYFLNKARSDFGVLLICAKDLFVEATQVASAEGNGETPIASGGKREGC